jgi:hypothetical protein
MLTQAGVIRGGDIMLTVQVIGTAGNPMDINLTRLRLDIYKPDNSLFATFTAGFGYDVENKMASKVVSIPETEMTGVWVAVWRYVDDTGKVLVEEFPFFVVDPAYR